MRWSYKTVHYDLKKEGILGSAFLDEPEIELSLNQYGKAGWELVSLLETMDGVIAVFKQPLDLDTRSFSSSSDLTGRMGRLPNKAETKVKPFQADPDETNKFEIVTEDVAEAVMLDEFEIVEDEIVEDEVEEDEVEEEKMKRVAAESSAPTVDVGMIRIE